MPRVNFVVGDSATFVGEEGRIEGGEWASN